MARRITRTHYPNGSITTRRTYSRKTMFGNRRTHTYISRSKPYRTGKPGYYGSGFTAPIIAFLVFVFAMAGLQFLVQNILLVAIAGVIIATVIIGYAVSRKTVPKGSQNERLEAEQEKSNLQETIQGIKYIDNNFDAFTANHIYEKQNSVFPTENRRSADAGISAGRQGTPKVCGLERNEDNGGIWRPFPYSYPSIEDLPEQLASHCDFNTVTFREVMESEQMKSAVSVLTVVLGKTDAGEDIVCDLAKMPHMLIAGQTGSGKSVCINAIICSLLYRASPDEVKLILIDPKVVELQCYNGIPHLLIPVVNDPRKAAAALAWAVAEMMERYDRFAEKKVRNLEGYNQLVERTGEKPMARIVIIIDELAELKLSSGETEIEQHLVRLIEMGRLAGVHIIISTQRLTSEYLDSAVRNGLPGRIAFKVSTVYESKAVINQAGAEKLLGTGDMLYVSNGFLDPIHVQGCYLSDEDVYKIIKSVKENNPSTYNPDILERLDWIAHGCPDEYTDNTKAVYAESDFNELLEKAVKYAVEDGQISTSTLQRRLKIGYARSGRLLDEMERRGIVGAKDGSKPRKCLITWEEWERVKQV